MLRQLPTNLRKNSSPVRELSVSTAARQGHLFRPLPLMQRVAGAKAIPDARRADGAPQQARTSPRPQAGEGSRRCPMRHAADGGQPNPRNNFRVTEKRGVRGCAPTTPPPTPRAGQATCRPCRAAAAMHRGTPAGQNVSSFSKEKRPTLRGPQAPSARRRPASAAAPAPAGAPRLRPS